MLYLSMVCGTLIEPKVVKTIQRAIASTGWDLGAFSSASIVNPGKIGLS